MLGIGYFSSIIEIFPIYIILFTDYLFKGITKTALTPLCPIKLRAVRLSSANV